MKKVIFSVGSALALMLANCSTIPTGAGIGALYTGTSEGSIATSNTLGTKVGTSSSTGVLGLVVVGDASIQSAANKAGIKKVSHVDIKKQSILGLFSTYKTVVYGD